MDDVIAEKIKSTLTDTPWNVEKLERISGGNANFTYHGYTKESTIFIKHAEPFAALDQAYALDATRSDFEWFMIENLSDRPGTKTGNFEVRTPKAIGSYGTTKIIEDLPESLTVKAYLSEYAPTLEHDVAKALGASLGRWLADFHLWLNADNEAARAIRDKLRDNPLIGPRADLYIGNYKECTKQFPQLQWPSNEEFAAIERHVRDMYSNGEEAIHGDFWTGNMILKDQPLPPVNSNDVSTIFILDFEVSQHGSRAQDLAQCLAELWMVHHFYGAEAPLLVMRGLVEAYFTANTSVPVQDLTLQIAIHFGVHIVVIPSRYGWPKGEKLVECVDIGNGCLVNGYKKNSEWFNGGPLEFLFSFSG